MLCEASNSSALCGENMKYHSEYTKLIFAQSSMYECSEYLQLYKSGYQGNSQTTRAFQRAISKAFVITYAKPFLKSNKGTKENFGGGSIQSKWVNCDLEIKKTHEQIVKHSRNLWVAHTDLSSLEPEIKLSGSMKTIVTTSQEYYLDEFGFSNLHKLLTLCENSIAENMKKLRKHILSSNTKCNT